MGKALHPASKGLPRVLIRLASAVAGIVYAATAHADPCHDAVQKAGLSGTAMARCMAPERPDVAVLACTEVILACQRDPLWLEQLHVARASAHLQTYINTGDQRSEEAALRDCAFVILRPRQRPCLREARRRLPGCWRHGTTGRRLQNGAFKKPR